MMRALLDVDGVLGDFPNEVLRFCNRYGRASEQRPWVLEDAVEHDILKALKLEHLQDRLDVHMADSDFCRYMPVYEGAEAFVDELRTIAEVVVVTSPYSAVDTWCHARLAWLEKNFAIDKRDVIFAKRKSLVDGSVLIDDKLKNCLEFSARASGRAIVFDQPWNKDDRLWRARSYSDAIQLVRRVKETS